MPELKEIREISQAKVKLSKNSAGIHYEISVYAFDEDKLIEKLESTRDKVQAYIDKVQDSEFKKK